MYLLSDALMQMLSVNREWQGTNQPSKTKKFIYVYEEPKNFHFLDLPLGGALNLFGFETIFN